MPEPAPQPAPQATPQQPTAQELPPEAQRLEVSPAVFQLGLSTGYGRAVDSKSGRTMTYATPSILPLILDAGYRTPHWFFGVFGQVALVSRADCGQTRPCSAKDFQLGLNVHYHARPDQNLDPWFGAGFAYETVHLSGLSGSGRGTVDRTGYDFLIMQAGLDVRLGKGETGRKPRIGPFIGLTFGQMSSESRHIDATGGTTESKGSVGHQWLVIGARGTIDVL